jgi:hypothetical protein
MPRRIARQAALARRARRENDGESASESSWACQMEVEEQQLPGADNHGQVSGGLDAPGAPDATYMPPGARHGRGVARQFPMPVHVPPAGHRNLPLPPLQSSDAFAVVRVLPLIGMVRSQDTVRVMTQADLDRWHQHGRMFMSSLKIHPFGEVPMTSGTQQKLLVWFKNTTAALVAYWTTSLEYEDMILQKLTDAIQLTAKLTWDATVESAVLEQPLTGSHRGVGTVSLTWSTLRDFLRCYDNPHDKDEMEQRLDNWKWAKTIPETQASFNDMVHTWTQEAQQTVTLDFDRQVAMPTQHVILEQIVRKMPPWAKKHMQEHPRKYSSVPQLWVALKEEEANRMTRSSTDNIHVLTTIRIDMFGFFSQNRFSHSEDGCVCVSIMRNGCRTSNDTLHFQLHFQCVIFSRGIDRPTCIHVVTRH